MQTEICYIRLKNWACIVHTHTHFGMLQVAASKRALQKEKPIKYLEKPFIMYVDTVISSACVCVCMRELLSCLVTFLSFSATCFAVPSNSCKNVYCVFFGSSDFSIDFDCLKWTFSIRPFLLGFFPLSPSLLLSCLVFSVFATCSKISVFSPTSSFSHIMRCNRI